MEMKKWSHRYNINRPSSWYGHKYSKYDVWWYSVWWHLYVATYEAQFIKMLSNTEAELKKSVAYKKECICVSKKSYNP